MPMGGQVVDERARIAIVSVTPGTGEVVWDEFDGTSDRVPRWLILRFGCPDRTGDKIDTSLPSRAAFADQGPQ